MSLMEFVKAILGLGLGVIVTGAIFTLGYLFIEDVQSEGKKDMFIIVISVLFWIRVSYGVIVWVM